jgi:hypothetical protein
MKRMLLLAVAAVLPRKQEWSIKYLGPGAIVGVLRDGEDEISRVSPVTGTKGEYYVRWVDGFGEEQTGWLACNTPMKPVRSEALVYVYGGETGANSERVSPWDRLRAILRSEGWTVYEWCSKMKPTDRQLARAVIRELGGSVPKTTDNALLQQVLLRVTQAVPTPQEVQMGSKKKTKVAASASTKATKTEKATEGRANSAMVTCATALQELGLKHKAIATLAGDTMPSRKELEALRDFVNTCAQKAREADKGARASKLSAANKLVRRLARKA